MQLIFSGNFPNINGIYIYIIFLFLRKCKFHSIIQCVCALCLYRITIKTKMADTEKNHFFPQYYYFCFSTWINLLLKNWILFFFFAFFRDIYSVIVHDKSMSTSNSHIEGCSVQWPEDNGRFYVLWWGECFTGTIAAYSKNGRDAEN